MSKLRQFFTFMLVMFIFASTGCASLAKKPYSTSQPIAASSMEVAVRAALAAAAETRWIPVTVSAETGYIMAERGNVILGRSNDTNYRLQVQIPPQGRGQATVMVAPPTGVVGGQSTQAIATEYIRAFERHLGGGQQAALVPVSDGAVAQPVPQPASQLMPLAPAPVAVQEMGQWGAGLNVGLSGGYAPALQYNMNQNLALEANLALYTGVTAIGGEALYRFKLEQGDGAVNFEPVAGGGLHHVSVDTWGGNESLLGFSASGGAFMHLTKNQHWRFKGLVSYTQFDYEGVALRGTGLRLGAFYFF
jgi:hypothetical protein